MEDHGLQNDLKYLQNQLNYLLFISPVVIYTARLEYPYPTTFISDNVLLQTGYEPREFIDNPVFWMNKTHPDDLPLSLLEMARLAEVGKINLEYRFMHK